MTNNYFHIAEIDSTTRGPWYTGLVIYIRTLALQRYEENKQFDFQEYLSYIVNLFYHWVNIGSNNDNYGIPDNCLFILDKKENVPYNKCNRYAKKYLGRLCIKLLILNVLFNVRLIK